jgi:hypothetical protein
VSNLEWEIQPEAKKKIMRVVCSMLVRGLSKGLHVKLTKNLFAEFLIAEKYRLNFAEILFAEIFICRNFHLPKYFRGIFACRTIIYFRHLFENLVALILGLLFPQLKICMYVFIFDKNRSR